MPVLTPSCIISLQKRRREGQVNFAGCTFAPDLARPEESFLNFLLVKSGAKVEQAKFAPPVFFLLLSSESKFPGYFSSWGSGAADFFK
jgi:hypothetical protein